MAKYNSKWRKNNIFLQIGLKLFDKYISERSVVMDNKEMKTALGISSQNLWNHLNRKDAKDKLSQIGVEIIKMSNKRIKFRLNVEEFERFINSGGRIK